jgi:hypothetical protein
LGKWAGHPVDDDADAGLVQPVDEVPELVGGAEARRRGVVAGDLVAPGAAERVLGDRQQLDVRVAQPADVLGSWSASSVYDRPCRHEPRCTS